MTLPRWAPPQLLLAVAMAGAAALTFAGTAGHNFYADEVQILSSYDSWDPSVLLKAAGGHLILTSLFLYKGIFELFGADSYLPNRIVHVGLALVCAALFYALVRRRIGDLAALAPTVVLLFLGSGAELTATPFGVLGYVGIGFGLAMFLALEREDRLGDILACAFLAAGLASYSISVAFAVAAAVLIWDRGPERRRRSVWIVAAPFALYLLWRVTELDPTETNISFSNALDIVPAMITSLAAACASLAGLFRVPSPAGPVITTSWGYPLAALLVGAVIYRLHLRPPVNVRFWAWLAALASFWGLVALNLGPLREPEATRYVYIGALLLLLLIVEMAAGLRLPRWAPAAVAGAVAVSVLANAIALHQAGDTYRIAGESLSAQLAAAELAGDRADPEIPVLPLPDLPVVQDLMIPIADYRDASDEFGSPAFSENELERSPEAARAVADSQFVRVLGIHTEPLPAPPPPCRTLPLTPMAGGVAIELPPGGATLEADPGAPVSIALRRFSEGAGTPLTPIAGGAAARVAIPTDDSAQPWTLMLSAAQPVRVCAA